MIFRTLFSDSRTDSFGNLSFGFKNIGIVCSAQGCCAARGSFGTSKVSGSTIPAKTGVILFSKTGGNITITEAAENASVANISTNKLVATNDNTVKTSSNKCFVLQEKSGQMTFVKVAKNTTLAANTAYLEGSSLYSNMKLSVEGENPEVSGVENVEAENTEVEYYNLHPNYS